MLCPVNLFIRFLLPYRDSRTRSELSEESTEKTLEKFNDLIEESLESRTAVVVGFFIGLLRKP